MKPVYESIEWDNTWIQSTENLTATRILYIGDSISVGTRGAVNPMGGGEIVFDNYGSSKALDHPYFFESVELFAKGQPKRDAILFNNGLHGWHLTDGEYEALYAAMLDRLTRAFPGTPLLLLLSTFTTSPGSPVEIVRARNAIVERLAGERGLPVVDLYAVAYENRAHIVDGVHFDQVGYEALAAELLRAVKAL